MRWERLLHWFLIFLLIPVLQRGLGWMTALLARRDRAAFAMARKLQM